MARPDHDRHPRPGRSDAPAPPVLLLAGADARLARLIPDNDNGRHPAQALIAEELRCLRGVLPPDLLRRATRRALALGIGADRVVIQWGAIDEAGYVRRLASALGTTLFAAESAEWLPGDKAAQAAAAGILPIRRRGGLIFVIAPRGLGARGLLRFAARYPTLIRRIELATAAQLEALLVRQAGTALVRRAAGHLTERWPDLSAAPRGQSPASRMARIGGAGALIALPPLVASGLWASALAAVYLAFIGLRLVASCAARKDAPRRARTPDHGLPVYTIIAALYREASSVAPLMHALGALDYPPEKLDLILVIEADDAQTRAAIRRFSTVPHRRVLIVPPAAPKTKPKALNYALPFARGSFIAVFDAEDRPEPGQLRAALDTFAAGDDALACAQASLCIDNAAASLLSRMFAAEYAGQFDVVLPGLAAMHLPLPLGGSSNHFRTAVLREVGGWDAYNVTEDADLGMRLARFGYRSTTFAASTYEEAPIRLGPWLRQRTRWMKGWMQSWQVHMRRPRRLWRDTGARGFIAFNLIVGGNVASALAYPSLIGGWLMLLAAGRPDGSTTLQLGAVACGLLASIGIGLAGLRRRGLQRHGWILLLTPLYWALLSLAAWRALWQLLHDPYRWEKTEHGLSRRAAPPGARGNA